MPIVIYHSDRLKLVMSVPDNSLHLNVKLLAWFNFFLDLRFYTPILVIYFSQVVGSYTLAMGLFSAVMLSSAAFEIPTGILSDKLGRKSTVVLGSVAAFLAVLFYAVGSDFYILLLGAVFEGLSRSLFSGNNDALLHDSLLEKGNQKDFAEFSGKTGSFSQIAIAIVSVLGGIMAFYSYHLVMYFSLIPALIGVYIAGSLKEPKIDSQKNEGNIFEHLTEAIYLFWTNKKLRLLSVGSMIGYAQSEVGYQFRSAFFITLWPVWAIGIAKALGSIGAAASFWFAGSLIKKIGEFPVLLISKGYSLLTNIVGTVFPNIFSPIIISSNSLFFGCSSTASSALKQMEYTQKQRATMASLDSLGGSLMYSFLAVLLGAIADNWSPAGGILSLQLLALISLIITWYLFHQEKSD